MEVDYLGVTGGITTLKVRDIPIYPVVFDNGYNNYIKTASNMAKYMLEFQDRFTVGMALRTFLSSESPCAQFILPTFHNGVITTAVLKKSADENYDVEMEVQHYGGDKTFILALSSISLFMYLSKLEYASVDWIDRAIYNEIAVIKINPEVTVRVNSTRKPTDLSASSNTRKAFEYRPTPIISVLRRQAAKNTANVSKALVVADTVITVNDKR